MARREVAQDAPDTSSVETLMAAANDAEEWDTVLDESPVRIIMDTVGDCFIGDYEGELYIPAEQNITKDKPEGEAFTLLIFRGLDGKPYALNKTVKLERAFDAIAEGSRVRVTLMKEIDTDRGNPMKDYKVDVARPRV